jgi:hypothetical protein
MFGGGRGVWEEGWIDVSGIGSYGDGPVRGEGRGVKRMRGGEKSRDGERRGVEREVAKGYATYMGVDGSMPGTRFGIEREVGMR